MIANKYKNKFPFISKMLNVKSFYTLRVPSVFESNILKKIMVVANFLRNNAVYSIAIYLFLLQKFTCHSNPKHAKHQNNNFRK